MDSNLQHFSAPPSFPHYWFTLKAESIQSLHSEEHRTFPARVIGTGIGFITRDIVKVERISTSVNLGQQGRHIVYVAAPSYLGTLWIHIENHLVSHSSFSQILWGSLKVRFAKLSQLSQVRVLENITVMLFWPLLQTQRLIRGKSAITLLCVFSLHNRWTANGSVFLLVTLKQKKDLQYASPHRMRKTGGRENQASSR